MSVVVWDGKSLAVDRGATDGFTMWELEKYWEQEDAEETTILTGVGAHATLVALRDWYLGGHLAGVFPRSLAGAELIVASRSGLRRYEHTSPHPIDHKHNKCAFGAGRDFAYGAMAMGATAEQAARIACEFSVSCGHGVKVFSFE